MLSLKFSGIKKNQEVTAMQFSVQILICQFHPCRYTSIPEFAIQSSFAALLLFFVRILQWFNPSQSFSLSLFDRIGSAMFFSKEHWTHLNEGVECMKWFLRRCWEILELSRLDTSLQCKTVYISKIQTEIDHVTVTLVEASDNMPHTLTMLGV